MLEPTPCPCHAPARGRWVRNYAEKITDFYAFFRGFSRFYAQIRAVITRFYAFLRVGAFFSHG
jgi:hypothetical protein